MTEEKLKEMLQNKYRETKSLWSLPPVDSKYEKMIIDVMKDVYNQGVKDSIKNVELDEYDINVIDTNSLYKLLIP